MPGPYDDVEVFPRNGTGDAAYDVAPQKRSRRRLKVFFLTFIILLVAGQVYNFQRPAVYRSSASLLTTALPTLDQPVTEADNQHVMLQRQKLLGKPLLDDVISRLKSGSQDWDGFEMTIYQLQSMLSVEPVPETHLVALQAKGSDPGQLSQVVNTWISSYLDLRANEIKSITDKTTGSLRKQLTELKTTIVKKRNDLDIFRKSNEILSLEREENQILAKLKGLSDALNKANEEKVKAKSRLDAIDAAVKSGKVVVPEEDKRSLALMEQRAQELREQLSELDRRFTRSFIALSPELKVVPEKLKDLEAKIAAAHKSGRTIATNIAQQEYAAAVLTVEELEKQLGAHKRKATEFTARFAEHEAKIEDISSLEELYREVEGELVQIQTENRQKYPQVKVVDWAIPPKYPISPDYVRDALIILGISFAAALIMVLITDFLAPKEKEGPTILPGVAIYPAMAPESLTNNTNTINQLEENPSPALVHQQHAELTDTEIALLFKGSDPAARLFLALMLHGLSAEEIRELNIEDVDTQASTLKVGVDAKRQIDLSEIATNLVTANNDLFPGWIDKDGQLPEKPELDVRMKMAAADSGLERWEECETDLIRHTYIVYLVRQGIKFSDLEQIIGRIPPQQLMHFRTYSPSGAGLALTDINTIYPIVYSDTDAA